VTKEQLWENNSDASDWPSVLLLVDVVCDLPTEPSHCASLSTQYT